MNLRKAIEDINNNEGAWRKYSKAEIELAIEAREAREKGLKEGREEGREEQKIEIAKNMIKDGLDIATIEKYTGLSRKELEDKLEMNLQILRLKKILNYQLINSVLCDTI